MSGGNIVHLSGIRVSSSLHDEAKGLLTDGESLSSFVVIAVQREVERRRQAAAFIQRGLQRSREPSGYIGADILIAKLRNRLAVRRRKRQKASE